METVTTQDIANEKKRREKKARRRRRAVRILVILLLLAAGAAGYLYLRDRETEEIAGTSVTTYSASAVQAGRISTTLSGSGTLSAVRSGSFSAPGENTVIEAGATVGTMPDGTEGWGVATCGPNVTIAAGHAVPAGAMVYSGEEV